MAAKVIRGIVTAIDGLEHLPYKFAVPRPGKFKGQSVRAMVVHPYVVRYRVDEAKRTVIVTSVRHGARRNA